MSAEDGWSGQLLHQAALYDNDTLMQSLLEEGDESSNKDACDRMGRSVVYTAVSNNSLRCLEVLLKNGADPNIRAGERYNKMTPLHSAICDNKEDAVRLLLLHNADPDIEDMSGMNPLQIANNVNNKVLVSLIKAELERRKVRMHKIFKTFSELCATGETEKVQKLLNDNRSDLKRILCCVPKGGFPALSSAVRSGSYELVELLVELGAKPIPHTENWLTPLHLACETGTVQVAEKLMKSFPDLCLLRTVDHQLPIHRAAACNRAEILSFLLTYPYPENFMHSYVDPGSGRFYNSVIDVNPVDSSGMTPLHVACETGSLEAVQVLVNFTVRLSEAYEGLDPKGHKNLFRTASNVSGHSFGEMDPFTIFPVDRDLKSNEGLTALHYAIKNQHPDVAQALLKGGSDLSLTVTVDDEDLSFIAYALEKGDPEVFDLLLKYGAEDTNNVALRRAQDRGRVEIVQLLLQFKTSKDHIHTINKGEMKRIYSEVRTYGLDDFNVRANSMDADYRTVFPTSPVAVNWHGQRLNSIDRNCLTRACFLHNLSMRQVDDSITALFAITKVDISHNFFTGLSEIFFELPSLRVLNASENQIKVLPEERDLNRSVESLELEELYLQENRLSAIPAYLFRLPYLKNINLCKNSLKTVPIEIWTAFSLSHVNLAQNDLEDLPHWEGEPPSMSRRSTIVSIASSSDVEGSENDSGYSNFDQSFQDVQENTVNHFDCWRQRLTVSDVNAQKKNEKQTGIRYLNLSGNKFTRIPICLGCCTPNLEVLLMTDNRLESVGHLCNLPQTLVELSLCRTGLDSLLPWIHSVPTSLQCYGIPKSNTGSSCQMTTYRMSPRSISPSGSMASSFSPLQPSYTSCPHRSHHSLPFLEKLNLANNNLKGVVLTRMASIVSPTNLDNNASTFSMDTDDVPSRLLFPNLSELDISHNKLEHLTGDVGELSHLKVLSLSRNPLKELPPKLGLLKKLWKLELDGCHLDGVIQDIIKHSRYPTKDILGFLLSVLEESTEYNCMNLMIVGSHEIGKTSLLQKLYREGKVLSKTTHWKDRVSISQEQPQSSGQTLSTVGIDINELVIERRSKGIVHFRTWDFGGQREYYATHQYFLSPRSLYLVLWNVTHGPKGVDSLAQWLVNIQARAPGAPVIIVGTHLDRLEDWRTRNNYPLDFEEAMMGLVKKNFILVKEPEKCGLPNILCTINVSCKSGKNIKDLANMIYDQAFELRHPRSRTQKLLKQKIPKKYLMLQNVVTELAQERVREHKEPVLSKSKYMLCVANKMMEKAGTTFRDVEELEQATRFLHENGVLFHYEDLSLKDLYFLDPQWLCDQLAKVVTIKEINSFAPRGIMKIKNLEILFKNSLQPMDIQRDITSLLNKFEVALQFDEEHLLLPSLLPTEEELDVYVKKNMDVRIPLRRSCEDKSRPSSSEIIYVRTESGGKFMSQSSQKFDDGHQESCDLLLLGVRATTNPVFSFCRLYFMTYFPSGFWPRLITRVLADSSLHELTKNVFKSPDDLLQRSSGMKHLFESDPEWRCWQTGIILTHLGFDILRIREIMSEQTMGFCDFSQCRLKCNVESDWSFLDVSNSKIMEISLPTDSLSFHLTNKAGPQVQILDPTKKVTVYRDDSIAAKLLGKLIEHIDNLLQDWYPEIGEVRFSQNCEGRYLITRVILCPQCLHKEVLRQQDNQKERARDGWFWINPEVPEQCSSIFISEEEAANSILDGVPGDAATTPDSDDSPVMDMSRKYEREGIIYSHLVERCMLDFLEGVNICCPVHSSISPSYLLSSDGKSTKFYVAPDLGFRDINHNLLVTETDRLDIGKSLGRGTFGQVYAGVLFRKGEEPGVPVAVKILFSSKREKSKLKKQTIECHMEQACQAYLMARQEISILESIHHPNIVPLLGLAVHPLSLILSLAPQGSLEAVLKSLNETGQRLPLFVIQNIIVQIAQALSYLHNRNIIYRDLKSDNVLVWSLPMRSELKSVPVEIKLADYGISRSVMPTGAKGFGGTPPFIAPEILQHAGKDTYSEKVDIFSFGMCIYELLTCRQPFADINNPSTLVCQGSRPSITSEEVNLYPCCVLDLMSLCWSQDPEERPSAKSIISIANSPQFCHLRDVVSLGGETKIMSTCSVPAKEVNEYLLSPHTAGSPGIDPELLSNCSHNENDNDNDPRAQVWLSVCLGPRYYIEVLSYDRWNHCVASRTIVLPGAEVTAMSVINNFVWCVDAQGNTMVFSSESHQMVYSFKLPVNMEPKVHGIYYVPSEPAIVITLKNGQIFVRNHPQPGEVSESRTDMYQIDKSYCSCCFRTNDGYKVWMGQDGGKITVWSVQQRCSLLTFVHPEPMGGNKCCKFLVSSTDPNTDEPVVYSYVYPGVVVYLWDTNTHTVKETLDCSRMVPSFYTPKIESPTRRPDNSSAGNNKYQVTAMNILGKYLYVGITFGNIIVTEAGTLKPVSVFKCHVDKEFYIRSILPLLSEDETSVSEESESYPGIVTLGRGYVDIIKESQLQNDPPKSEPDSPDLESRPRLRKTPQDMISRDPTTHHNFLLSWWAAEWEVI